MTVLKGIAWDHPRGFDPMVATANEFTKKNPNYKILWEKRPLQAFADRPIEEMAFEYDLMVIDHPHVGEASRKGLLLSLNKFEKYEENLHKLKKESVGISHESYEFNKNHYALSIDAATPVSAYRNDLIEKIPKTFEEVLYLAEAKKVMWPVKPVDSISSFNTIAANMGYPLNQENEIFIDNDISLLILKMMKRLVDLIPQDCLSMNPIQTLDYMSSNNDIAYCPLLYGYSNYSRKGFRQSIINFTNTPSFTDDRNNCSGSQIGGTGLAISKNCKNIDIALEYAFWVASDECQNNLFYFSGGQPGNITAWKNSLINEDCNNFFKDTLETLEKSWLRPRYDGYMYYQDIGGTLINRYLHGGVSAEDTLISLKKEFEKSFYVNNK